MRGLVTITKIYKDGTKETVIENEENTLTAGFSIALSRLLSKGTDGDLDDFRFGYFQLGTSSYYSGFMWDESLANATRKNFFKLHSPLQTAEDYGLNSSIEAVEKNTLTAEEQFVESYQIQYQNEVQVMAKLDPGKVSILNYNPVTQQDAIAESQGAGEVRLTQNSILVRITLDEYAAIGQDLREFGLFIKDPEEILGDDEPVLAAYKSIPTPITKTEDFILDIQWVIELFDTVNNYTALTDCVFFKPAYLKRSGTTQRGTFVKFIEEGDTYDLEIDSPVPTLKGGTLNYTIYTEGDEGEYDTFKYAKRNIHYNLLNENGIPDPTINSPMVWESGSSRKVIRIFAYPSNKYFQPRIIRFRLDNFVGDKRVPDRREDNYPREFIIVMRSKKRPQKISFVGNPTLGNGSNGIYTDYTRWIIKAFDNAANPAVDDSEDFSDDTSVIVKIESDSNYSLRINDDDAQSFNSSKVYHRINVEKGSSDLRLYVDKQGTGQVTLSIENNPHDRFFYNRSTYSNDFRAGFAGSALPSLLVEDVISHVNDLSAPNSEWFVDNFLGSKEWFDGFPTRLLHTGYDLYPSIPSPDVFVNDFVVSSVSTPDGIENPQFCYAHPFLYTWPDSEGNLFANRGGKISLAKTHRELDAVGGSTKANNNDDRYGLGDEVAVFSVYVKRPDALLDPNESSLDKSDKSYTCSASEYFALSEIVEGFPGIQTSFDGKGKSVIFKWSYDGTTWGLEAHKCYAGAGEQDPFELNNDNIRSILCTSSTVGTSDRYPTEYDEGKYIAIGNINNPSRYLGIFKGDEQGDDLTDNGPNPSARIHFRSDKPLSEINAGLSPTTTYVVGTVTGPNGAWDPQGMRLVNDNAIFEKSKGPYGFLDGKETPDANTNNSTATLVDFDCGVLSGTNGGNSSRDITKYGDTDEYCKDGWYRAWVASKVTSKIKPYNANQNPGAIADYSDGGGALHDRFIWPSVGEGEPLQSRLGLVVYPGDVRAGDKPNLGRWRQIPNTPVSSVDGYDLNRTVNDSENPLYDVAFLSAIPGTMFAWQQYDRFNAAEDLAEGNLDAATGKYRGYLDHPEDNKYFPRPYLRRPYAFTEPFGGLEGASDGTLSQSYTF